MNRILALQQLPVELLQVQGIVPGASQISFNLCDGSSMSYGTC